MKTASKSIKEDICQNTPHRSKFTVALHSFPATVQRLLDVAVMFRKFVCYRSTAL